MKPGKRILLWLLLISFSAAAQHPLVINYGKKDGLPSFEAYDVLQDSEGFIWVPTDCGVVKYDGYQFKVFNTESGLRNNCVFKIFEDHKKRKWLTTSTNELCYIEDDKVVYLPCSEEFSKLAGPFAAKRLIVDKNDNIYVSHRAKSSYYKITPPYTNKSFTPVFLDQTIGYGYVEEVGNNYVYGTNEIYAHQRETDLLQLRKGNRIHTLKLGTEYSTHVFAAAVGDGSYLFSEGKYLMKLENDTAYVVKKFEKNIISITIHKDEAWIGHYKGGISKFELKDFRFLSTFLPEYSVSGSCFDSEGNLWLSTLEGGIFSIPPLGTKYLNSSNGLSNENVLSTTIYNEKLVVGSYDGVLRFIEREKVTDVLDLKPLQGSANYVLLKYKDELLWGGGNGAYLLKDGKISKQISNEVVKSATTWKETIFLGTINEVLKWQNNKLSSISILNSRLTRLFCDRSGKLWVGSNRGLLSYQRSAIREELEFNRLFKGKITDIVQSADGAVWVGTNGKGLFRIKDDKVEHFSHLKDDNIVSCLVPDTMTGMLWVATSQAVYLIDPVRLSKSKVLTLRRYSFDITSIVRFGKTIYLCTTKGIFMVEEDQLMLEPKIPTLYLSSIEAGDKTYFPGDNVELPYSEARIRFTFKPITFMGIPPETYKYKLEGGDEKWHFTENNSVEYGLLKPGVYKFTVVSCDESGKVSPNAAEFSFTVHSPIYLRPWFVILVLVLVSSLLGFSAFQLIRYSRKKEKIRNDNEVKLADLELKALRSQMNPHFIFNSLNAVQGLILRNDSDGALMFMGKFSRLVRSVLENSEKPLIPLNEEISGLNLYLQLEQLKYDHIFNFSIVVDEHIIPNQVFLPSMLIQPLVENAIQHGVVKSERKGNIKVTFKLESDTMLLVVVEDNGVGFSNKKQKKAEERISLGMKVTNERLKLLEKRMFKGKENTSVISVNSVLGGGTAVYLKVPVYGKTSYASYNSR